MFEAPDLAVETLSPEESVTLLIAKCLRYLTFGTKVSVLIDPDQETVLTFRPAQPLRILQGQDRIDLDDVLPGFDLTVQGLFDAIASEFPDEDDGAPAEKDTTDESV
jgi:Uma2 family endonuclease